MKPKDVVYIIIAVLIFSVGGYIVYTQMMPKKSAAAKAIEVEVVGEIRPDLDETTLATLRDSSKVQDFSVIIDLKTGLNNPAPFGR